MMRNLIYSFRVVDSGPPEDEGVIVQISRKAKARWSRVDDENMALVKARGKEEFVVAMKESIAKLIKKDMEVMAESVAGEIVDKIIEHEESKK